jgi:hypothetical protein
LFSIDIFRLPRFLIIHQLTPDSVISGSSDVRSDHCRAFFLDVLAFNDDLFYPGTVGPVNDDIIQSTSFLLPNTPLLDSRLNAAGGNLPPVLVELVN